jgi:hypothetical protein
VGRVYAPVESIAQRSVLLVEVPLRGGRSIAALQRSLGASERLVHPADDVLRSDPKPPGDLVDGRLAPENLVAAALAVLLAASAGALELFAILLDPFIKP